MYVRTRHTPTRLVITVYKMGSDYPPIRGVLLPVAVSLCGVEKRRSDVSLPVAIGQIFTWPPQSGLAWFCFLLPSRPGEFRPEPLTDPCLTVSGHTARAPPGRLAPSAEAIRFLRVPVDPSRSRRGG